MEIKITKKYMNKIPNFIESRSAGARLGSDFIGITKNGAISIYAGFYNKNSLKKYSHCLLLLDKTQNLIGLQFGGEELGEGSYTVNHSANHKTASISAGNFFMHNGLSTSSWYGKYPPEKYNDGIRKNVFMLDLEQKKQINRKTRKLQD